MVPYGNKYDNTRMQGGILEKIIISAQLSCQFKMAEESTRLFQGSKIFTVAFCASFCRKKYDTYLPSKSGKPKIKLRQKKGIIIFGQNLK